MLSTAGLRSEGFAGPLEFLESDCVNKPGCLVLDVRLRDHNQIVADIVAKQSPLIKSKSLLTEECDTRRFFENGGVVVTETDLGERIPQLDHQPPGHIVGPAIQKSKEDVAAWFARTYGSDPHWSENEDGMTETRQRQIARSRCTAS
jgi:L-lactate utilization protein LutB